MSLPLHLHYESFDPQSSPLCSAPDNSLSLPALSSSLMSTHLSSSFDHDKYYRIPRKVREALESYQPENDDDDTTTFLNTFLDCLPADGAQHLCEDILECVSGGKLRQLRNSLETGIVVPMRMQSQTPTTSPSPQLGEESDDEDIPYDLVDSSFRMGQERLKQACLRRDNYRCVVTGFYDNDTAIELMKAEKLSRAEFKSMLRMPTVATQIIPSGLENTSIIWDALYRYFPNIHSDLNFTNENINDTCNAMTLSEFFHDPFDSFQLAFEPTATDNVYRIARYMFPSACDRWLPKNGLVTLTSHDANYPLPSRHLLELHASLAKFIYMTEFGDEDIED